MLHVSGIDFESIVDGEGVRVVVFFSGCLHNCEGCHNPASHSFEEGEPFTEELQNKVIQYVIDTPFVAGITLSGGDPMFSATQVAEFVSKFRSQLPNKTVWVYTGFTFEELTGDTEMNYLLNLCDVCVDGEFILAERSTTICYRGSNNQRIIDVQKSREAKSPIIWKE